MSDLRAELHEEIDRMAKADLAGLKEFLSTYPDLVGAAIRRATYDDEPVTEEGYRGHGRSIGMARAERRKRHTPR